MLNNKQILSCESEQSEGLRKPEAEAGAGQNRTGSTTLLLTNDSNEAAPTKKITASVLEHCF